MDDTGRFECSRACREPERAGDKVSRSLSPWAAPWQVKGCTVRLGAFEDAAVQLSWQQRGRGGGRLESATQTEKGWLRPPFAGQERDQESVGEMRSERAGQRFEGEVLRPPTCRTDGPPLWTAEISPEPLKTLRSCSISPPRCRRPCCPPSLASRTTTPGQNPEARTRCCRA